MIIAPLLVNPLQTISRFFVLKVVNSFIPAAIGATVSGLITSVYGLYSSIGFFKSIQMILRIREALRVRASLSTLKDILFRGNMPATAAQSIYALCAADWTKILKYVPYVYRSFNILLVGFALIIVLHPLLIWVLRCTLTLLFTAIGIMYTPSLKAIKWLKKYSLMVLSFTPLSFSTIVESSPALTQVKVIIEEPITESRWKQGLIAVLVLLGIILAVDHFKPDTPVVHDIAKGTKATLNFIGTISVAISTVASYPFVGTYNYIKGLFNRIPTDLREAAAPGTPDSQAEDITVNDIRTANAERLQAAANSRDPNEVHNLQNVIQPTKPRSRVDVLNDNNIPYIERPTISPGHVPLDNNPQIPPVAPPISNRGDGSTTRSSHSNSVTNDTRGGSSVLLPGYNVNYDEGSEEEVSNGGRTSPRATLSAKMQTALDYVGWGKGKEVVNSTTPVDTESNTPTPKPSDQPLPAKTYTPEELEAIAKEAKKKLLKMQIEAVNEWAPVFDARAAAALKADTSPSISEVPGAPEAITGYSEIFEKAWSKVTKSLTDLSLNSVAIDKMKDKDPITLQDIVNKISVTERAGILNYKINGKEYSRADTLTIINEVYNQQTKEGGGITMNLRNFLKSFKKS